MRVVLVGHSALRHLSVLRNLEFGGVDYPGIGVNSIHPGIMAVEASTKSNLVNNFDDDDDDGPVFFVRNNVASRQNQVNPDVRKPSSSTFNGQNSNAQKGCARKHDGDQPAT
ncbi:hypothetical protein QYF36_005934 [Acer negundo]|nr:hypothetical protein QYF36_005934 [Acer negundo]